jgi:hypothetical protein
MGTRYRLDGHDEKDVELSWEIAAWSHKDGWQVREAPLVNLLLLMANAP